MSAELMAWALRQDIGPAPKIVLIAICDQVSDQPGKEYFWGSQEWLATKIHSNPRSVRGHLATLEKDGWIHRIKRKENGEYTTDAIYVCQQRQEVADGKKTSSPAASSSPHQRQELARKNLTENLTENLKPATDDLFDKTPPKSKQKRATQIPQGFPDDSAITQAAEYFRNNGKPHINARSEAERFRDFKLADGKTHKDWDAAWRTWCRNAIKFDKPRNGFKDQSVSHGTIDASAEDWTRRTKMFHEKGMWSSDWGPKPDDPGCAAPPEILQKFTEQRSML